MFAADIAHRLGLRRHPRSWRGRCPACDYAGTFSVRAARDGRAQLFCANCRDRDALDDAVARALGLEREQRHHNGGDGDDARQQKKGWALALWRGSEAASGTPADAYLNARGLPGLAASPALRFRGDTPHPEGGKLPALVAIVHDVEGAPIAVHRTFLARNGEKARVEPAKASLGPVWGGAICLAPIVDGKPVVIGEGIESSASAGCLMGLPAWAAVSAGNLAKGLVLPLEARRIVIAADPDAAGRNAARDAWQRWRAEGRTCRSLRRMAQATSTMCCARGRLAVSEADELSDRDLAEEPPDATALGAALGAAGFTVTGTPPDPLNGLAERAKNDFGEPFKPDVLAALTQLRHTDRAGFETLRNKLKQAGVRVAELDKAMNATVGGDDNGGASKQGRRLALTAPEPWPEPVPLADVLNELATIARRHVVMSRDAVVAVTLWIVHTWIYERFEHSPRLAITSPTKRCGKSTLLAIIGKTAHMTLKADNISASGVFRTVEALRPLTLSLDEVDAFARENEELRGVLNSGYERSGSVIRVVEVNGEHRPMQFATFCPVALASIGNIPSTLADRAVPIPMQRKAATEIAAKLRDHGAADALHDIARKLARWTADAADGLAGNPVIPDALNDRQGDISVPLLAIADAAGGEWPDRARRALLALFGLHVAAEADAESGVLLLTDIRAIFIETGGERIASTELCSRLADLDARPWPEWRHGKPMTPPQLATALRPFSVRPQTMRLPDGRLAKGYQRDHFADAWARYVPSSPTSAPASSATASNTVTLKADTADFPKSPAVTPSSGYGPPIRENRSANQQCYGVAASKLRAAIAQSQAASARRAAEDFPPQNDGEWRGEI